MSKEILVEELQQFHSHHDKSLRGIKNAIEGLTKGEAACTVFHECAIQKWIVKRRDVLVHIFGGDTIKALEVRHEEWHDESAKVCELVAQRENRQKGLLKKVMGKKEKMREDEYDMALAYYSNLQELTVKIDATFQRMSKRANALPNDMFEGIA